MHVVDKDEGYFSEGYFRLYPNGVIEKGETLVTEQSATGTIPQGNVFESTRWVFMDAAGKLNYGSFSQDYPKTILS